MKKYFVLIVALVIGAFLRLWMLAQVPNGLTWDEAAIGYNAFSILKTSRDEHGAFLPVIFKSFGDYKPGAYIYLTVPAVAIFGLNEFSVRFPSALAGILAIWGVWLLTKAILLSSVSLRGETTKQSIKIFGLSLHPWDFAALALAISPWLVHFSHGAWEVNVYTTLTIFALYYFLLFLKHKSSPLPFLFFACFSLAMYQAAKLLTPLVFLLLLIVYWKDFWQQFTPYLKPKKFLLILPFILFGLWIFFGSIFSSAGNRLNRLSIFNYRPPVSEETIQIDGQNSPATPLFHNQVDLSAELVASRYLYHFSPEVLYYEGSRVSLRGHIPGLGVLNPLEFIWLVFGFIWLAKSTGKSKVIILGLLFLSPIPASLTLEEFSTVRSLFMAVPLAIISGLGIFYCLKSFRLFSLPLILIYSLITVYVFDLYFFHSQTAFASEFNYGYKQVVGIIKENPAKKVIFTDVYGQPYIYYLFYTAFDPATYQKNVDFIDGGQDVGRVGHVGNVEFHQFGESELNLFKDTLFIGTEGNINNQTDITGPNIAFFKQIETPDHHILFRIIKTKP